MEGTGGQQDNQGLENLHKKPTELGHNQQPFLSKEVTSSPLNKQPTHETLGLLKNNKHDKEKKIEELKGQIKGKVEIVSGVPVFTL